MSPNRYSIEEIDTSGCCEPVAEMLTSDMTSVFDKVTEISDGISQPGYRIRVRDQNGNAVDSQAVIPTWRRSAVRPYRRPCSRKDCDRPVFSRPGAGCGLIQRLSRLSRQTLSANKYHTEYDR